jgi:hypothetical protein
MINLERVHLENLCGIKKLLINSEKWDRNLSGACNVSSLIVQAYFQKHGINSKIVNNSRHSFNVINETTIVDLTACQISSDEFNSFVEIDSVENMQKRINGFDKGVGFFNLKDPRFLIIGNLKELLKPLKDKDDIKCLKIIMKDICDVVFLKTEYSDYMDDDLDDNITSSYNNVSLLGEKISFDLINKI